MNVNLVNAHNNSLLSLKRIDSKVYFLGDHSEKHLSTDKLQVSDSAKLFEALSTTLVSPDNRNLDAIASIVQA